MAAKKYLTEWLIALLTIASAASGTTFYVSTSGNDAWDGLAPAWDGAHGPKATIQAAIDIAALRNTVQVAAGTYPENIRFNGNDITLTSTNPSDWSVVETTIIQGDGTTAVVKFSGTETSACELKGFTITGGNQSYAGGGIDGNYLNPNHAAIRRCIVRNNRADWCGGIAGCDGLIESCRIIQNEAVYGAGGLGLCDGTIASCLIAENVAGDTGGAVTADGRIINCTIVNNTLLNGEEGAKRGGAFYWCKKADVVNCIVWGNSKPQSVEAKAPMYSCVEDLFEGEGNISLDPQFMDSAGGNYRIPVSSPCTEAGTNTPSGGLPTADLDGGARKIDGDVNGTATVDMGAYEYAPMIPVIDLSDYNVNFEVSEYWPLPGDQGITVRNTTTGVLRLEIQESCDWLEVTPLQGQINTSQNLTLLFHLTGVSGLVPGIHTCPVTVADLDGNYPTQTITVTLNYRAAYHVPGDYAAIQSAIDGVPEKSTILVAPGTYKEKINFNGKAILLRSENPSDWSVVESTIIDGQQYGTCVRFVSGEGPESVLEGFTLTNGKAYDGGGIFVKDSSPVIRRCSVNGVRGRAVCLTGTCQAEMSNCFIVDNTADYVPSGLYIHCDFGSINPQTCTPRIDHCTIANNYVKSNGQWDFQVDCFYARPLIQNTIICSSPGRYSRDILIAEESRPDVRYCCISSAYERTASSTVQEYDITEQGGNISAYPGFTELGTMSLLYPSLYDITPGDYHLRPDSPCFNAGDPAMTDLNATDIDGQSRIMGSRADIGADEIPPTLVLQSPRAGEVWAAGSSHFIRWNSVGYEEAVNLFYSTDQGANWNPIANDLTNTGEYEWTLPAGVDSAVCMVKIEAASPPPWIQYKGMDGLFAIHASTAGADVPSDWPTLGGRAARTGLSGLQGPDLGCIAWQFDSPEKLSGGVVFGAEGLLHLSGEEGTLYTLDAGGNLLWSYAAGSELSTTPAVGHDGTVYIGNGNGTLFAIDKSGQLRWTHAMNGEVLGSAVVGANHQVYVASLDGKVYALAEDGSELWTFTVEPNGRLPGAILAPLSLAQDGSVLVGCATQPFLYALGATSGSVLWKRDFSAASNPYVNPNGSWVKSGFVSAPVAGPDGTIYVSMIKDTHLYALNPADGSTRWALDLGNPASGHFDYLYQRSFYRSAWTEPAVGPDGTVYVSFGAGDGYLRAVNPGGTMQWVKRLGCVGEFTLTVDTDGLIYAAGEDASLYVLNPAGDMVSRFDGADSLSYPVVGEEKTMYVLDDARKLYAVKLVGCPAQTRPLHRIFDPNGDGVVNNLDLLILRTCWMKNTSPYDPTLWPIKTDWSAGHVRDVMYLQGDFNRDLAVNLKDLEMIRNHWLLSE